MAHAERLTPSWWVWAVLLGGATSLGLALLPVAPPAVVLGTAAGTLVVGGAGLVASAARVAVEDGVLVAGRARLPLRYVASVEPLDAAAMRRARGPELDARSYLLLRGWVATGVRVVLDDPDDPVPSWLVSTRRPVRLAAAVEEGRRRADAARS